jgi:hypothetical protein
MQTKSLYARIVEMGQKIALIAAILFLISLDRTLAQDKPGELPAAVQALFPKGGKNEIVARLDYDNQAYVAVSHAGNHDGELLLYRYDKLNGTASLVKADQALFPFNIDDRRTPPEPVRKALAAVLAQRAVAQDPQGVAGVRQYFQARPDDWAAVPGELKAAYQALGVHP